MGTTATFAIRYPDGTDQVCDTPTFIQHMAEDIDAVLDGLDFDLNRLVHVPYARVSAVNVFDSGGVFIGYNTVDVDYANMFQLDLDPISAYPKDNAFWVAGQKVGFTAINLGNAGSVSVRRDNTDATTAAEVLLSQGYDPGPGITFGVASMQDVNVVVDTITAQVAVGPGFITSAASQGATFFVFWQADV